MAVGYTEVNYLFDQSIIMSIMPKASGQIVGRSEDARARRTSVYKIHDMITNQALEGSSDVMIDSIKCM